jgi:hypothetical protein
MNRRFAKRLNYFRSGAGLHQLRHVLLGWLERQSTSLNRRNNGLGQAISCNERKKSRRGQRAICVLRDHQNCTCAYTEQQSRRPSKTQGF